MNFSHKYYLNGIDWVNNALHYQCCHTPAAGNCFIIVLELQGRVTIEQLHQLQQKFRDLRPLLNGHITRQKFHLAPYWKILPAATALPEFDYREVAETALNSECRDYINQPFQTGEQHLAGRCLVTAEQTTLLFKFDHRLFDGRGGEMLLAALQDCWQDENIVSCKEPDCLSPQLSKWQSRFDSGKKVNRWLRELRQGSPLLTFSDGTEVTKAPSNFKILHLTEAQTQTVFKRAEASLGPFMNTPYLAAITATALSKLARRRGENGQHRLMLPMTVDLRGTTAASDQLFFNQWSLAPLVVNCHTADSLQTIAKRCQEQFINICHSGFMNDIRNANLLTRIVPLPIFAHISNNIFAGTAGSCSFAFIPQSSLAKEYFIGYHINSLYHLPTLPPRPGIGIFMTNYRQRLTVTISYREGVILEEEAAYLTQQLKALLYDEKNY